MADDHIIGVEGDVFAENAFGTFAHTELCTIAHLEAGADGEFSAVKRDLTVRRDHAEGRTMKGLGMKELYKAHLQCAGGHNNKGAEISVHCSTSRIYLSMTISRSNSLSILALPALPIAARSAGESDRNFSTQEISSPVLPGV